MSKKPDLRTPFDSQHAKKVQKLLKSVRQLFYQTFQSIFKRLSRKMSLLVICEILGLLVDTLMSILFVIRRIYCNQFKRNYLRNKIFFLTFCSISEICITFWNYRLQKTWLDESLKISISELLSTVNIPKGPKHCWNLHDSTFIIFVHNFARNYIVKLLC